MPGTEFETLSVLIPTRHRVERLEQLLASYEMTTDGECSELVFRVDEDDEETQDFLRHRLGEEHQAIVGPRLSGYGSMPVFFNELARIADGDVLLCGNDDMVFVTQDWPEWILAAANEFPDGLFDIGVDTHNAGNFPFSIVSRKVVDRLGFIWDPRIFWGDIFLRDTMATLGRCVALPSVRIEHDWAGFKPDRVFAETRPYKEQVESSTSYWTTVHALAVSEAAEKLRGLLQ